MIEPSMLIILGLVALAAGFIDAVAGGGGMLTVPALLSIGLPPHIALGTNKLAATFASSTAAWTYYKKQLFSPAFWRMSFVATLIGAISGTPAHFHRLVETYRDRYAFYLGYFHDYSSGNEKYFIGYTCISR